MKTQTLKVAGMLLIRIEGAIVTNFSNAIEKEEFYGQHQKGTYELTDNGNAVREFLYMIIDPEGTGFCLTKSGVTYNEAITTIGMYL